MPSTSLTRWALAAAGVAAVCVAVAWAIGRGAMFSPGALHAGRADDSASTAVATSLGGVASHAELARNCAACHAPPAGRERMADRCLTCHVEVKEEIGDTTRLHGILPDVARCRSCHVEHRGPRAILTEFDGRGFPHERLGFSLAAHRRTAEGETFTCSSCHTGGTFRFAREGCATCHTGYQPRFVAAHTRDWGNDCRACHEGTDVFSGFRHDTLSFRLTGRHARIQCTSCHTAVRAFSAFADAPSTCFGCHQDDDAHEGENGTDCASCHNTTDWEDADDDRGRGRGRGRGGDGDRGREDGRGRRRGGRDS